MLARNDVPTEQLTEAHSSLFVQVNPYRLLFVSTTDAGATLVSTCTSDECHQLFEVFVKAPNAGVDDAGALFIADYIFDAGVRVTRFAPGAW